MHEVEYKASSVKTNILFSSVQGKDPSQPAIHRSLGCLFSSYTLWKIV